MENITSIVDYSRQQQLDRELRFDKRGLQVIVGCGGIGFWLGLFLAMNGFDNFILIDGEKIETSNLNRLPVPQTWVGRNKTYALKRVIRQLRPDTVIVPFQSHITEHNMNVLKGFIEKHNRYGTTNIWDTTDDARIQVRIHALTKKLSNVSYRKLGYEGFNVGYYANYDVWFNEETYQRGYRTTMANAMTSAISAGLGIFAKQLGVSQDTELNLKDLVRQVKRKTPDNAKVLKGALDVCMDYIVENVLDTDEEEDRDFIRDIDERIGGNEYEEKYI